MPLYKRKPFNLLELPRDLDPKESVFQVRFTKEIFRDYEEYLKRLNLYRQRVWTCKVTGKTNLTYEEALVSEHRAAEKAQQFPNELMAPVLRMIQYSTLSLYDLVNKIHRKLQEDLFEGLELHGRKGESVSACKILKILECGNTTKYEVGWIVKDRGINGTAIVKAGDLICKRPPLSRYVLKVFIRESTSQSAPWVIHERLAKKHGILTELPEDLKDKLTFQNGCLRYVKESKRAALDDIMDAGNPQNLKKRKRLGNGTISGKDKIKGTLKQDEENPKEEPVRYPIDDLLVKAGADDPIFTKRPPLSMDFRVPMDRVADLLTVWDFCISFGRLLSLSPFSLTDFENALCHKDSNLFLIVEVHAAILHLLIRDEGEYFLATQSKRRKSKITLVKWTEYLCDFLEMKDKPEFSSCLPTIRRGHYGLLDTCMKLKILRELVEEALTTTNIRDKIDERIDQQQELKATKREEAKRSKEEQGLRKEESDIKEVNGVGILENGGERRLDKKDNVKGRHKGKDKDENAVTKKTEEQYQHLEGEIEKLSIRTNSLGKDRCYNRYWFFRREGRLFVESADFKQWGYYGTKEELDALMGSLNQKGVRERALKRQLEKFYIKISAALEKRSKDVAQKVLLEEAVLRRSTRVRAQPRDTPAMAFLKYVNKWKEIRSP